LSLAAGVARSLTGQSRSGDALVPGLPVGLDFNDYSARVGDIRVAYDPINLGKVDTL
jgi:hypothetical protein